MEVLRLLLVTKTSCGVVSKTTGTETHPPMAGHEIYVKITFIRNTSLLSVLALEMTLGILNLPLIEAPPSYTLSLSLH